MAGEIPQAVALSSAAPAVVLETERLILRHFSPADAAFVFDLLNQPSFLRFIGDRGVRTPDDACTYIQNGPLASYERHGFGLYVIELKDSGAVVGMCGLLKKEWLDDVDLGFALLPAAWGQGITMEAARAVMNHGRTLGIERMVAVVDPANAASLKVLDKLGFVFERMAKPPNEANELKLLAFSHTQELPVYRNAVSRDAETLAAFAAAKFIEAYRDQTPLEDLEAYARKSFAIELIRAELESPDAIVTVCEQRSCFAGYALLTVGDFPECELAARRPACLQRIYVDPAWQGKGVAHELMRRCMAAAMAAECDVLWLAVWPKNSRAVRFYQKTGFRIVGEQPFVLEDDVQLDYVMVLPLQGS